MPPLIHDALKKTMFSVGFFNYMQIQNLNSAVAFIFSLNYGFRTKMQRFQRQTKLLLLCISYPSQEEMSPIYLTFK